MGVPVSCLTQAKWLPSGFGSPSNPPASVNNIILTTESIGPALFTAADTVSPPVTEPQPSLIANLVNAHSDLPVNPSSPAQYTAVLETHPSTMPSSDKPPLSVPTSAPVPQFPPPYLHNASSDTEPSDDYDTTGFKILTPPTLPPPPAIELSSDSSLPCDVPPFNPTTLKQETSTATSPPPSAPPAFPPGFPPTPQGRVPASGSFTIPLSSLDLTDINLEEAMNCPFTTHCKGEGQWPDLITEGNPTMAVKLFTLLMNQLAINPPSPQVVNPPPHSSSSGPPNSFCYGHHSH